LSSLQSAVSDPSAPQKIFKAGRFLGLYSSVADGVEWSFSTMILFFLAYLARNSNRKDNRVRCC